MAEITAQLQASNIGYFVHTFAQQDQVDAMVDIILNGNSSSVVVFMYDDNIFIVVDNTCCVHYLSRYISLTSLFVSQGPS
jgi:hypothetical protein